jgi:hypothetical protein
MFAAASPLHAFEIAAELGRQAVRLAAMAAVDVGRAPPPQAQPSAGPWASLDAVAHVIERATLEWQHGVREPDGSGPNGAVRIDGYIRGPEGLGWTSADAHDLNRPTPYTRNGQFAWCGSFAAFCWAAGGLRRDLRRDVMASTWKLWSWAGGTARHISPRDVRAGDVVVVGALEGEPAHGAHVTLCAVTPAKGAASIETIEGNAHGRYPDGSTQEGVVRGTHFFDVADPAKRRIRHVYRFLAADLEARP